MNRRLATPNPQQLSLFESAAAFGSGQVDRPSATTPDHEPERNAVPCGEEGLGEAARPSAPITGIVVGTSPTLASPDVVSESIESVSIASVLQPAVFIHPQ